jgi:hypothetical protein
LFLWLGSSLIVNDDSKCHEIHKRDLENLQKESKALGASHSQKLGEIAAIIQQIHVRIMTMESRPRLTLPAVDQIVGLENKMSQLDLSRQDLITQQAILGSLSFENRPARHSSIPQAHKETFKWIFKNPYTTNESTKFRAWLREGEGFFWISGKPGSGKSTLMKYIAESDTTKGELLKWSYPKRTVVGCHYFWSPGAPIQKSQEGLLRTLLYDIFRQCPEQIEPSCDSRWSGNRDDEWTVSELHQVLGRVSRGQDLPFNFCFFIDGMDEYEGDHIDF